MTLTTKTYDPDLWQLVPKKLTAEQLRAIAKAPDGFSSYAAALAAAPQPPEQPSTPASEGYGWVRVKGHNPAVGGTYVVGGYRKDAPYAFDWAFAAFFRLEGGDVWQPRDKLLFDVEYWYQLPPHPNHRIPERITRTPASDDQPVAWPDGMTAEEWAAWLKDRSIMLDPYIQGPMMLRLANFIENARIDPPNKFSEEEFLVWWRTISGVHFHAIDYARAAWKAALGEEK